jgi:RNA polymerase sigma-70 factor (ECF subfamily)
LSSGAQSEQTLPDLELVQTFLGGDRGAFEELMLRHQSRVYAFCYRYFGAQEPAEEAAQEVWVKIFRYLGRFRGDSKFTTWMYRVALNHCRNLSAYEGRRGKGKHDSLDAERDDGDGGVMRRQLADSGQSADAMLVANERRQMMHEELARLDPLWREVLLLRDVEGMSYDEVASALEVATGTVKSRIHRARTELKDRITRRMLGEARRPGEGTV